MELLYCICTGALALLSACSIRLAVRALKDKDYIPFAIDVGCVCISIFVIVMMTLKLRCC